MAPPVFAPRHSAHRRDAGESVRQYTPNPPHPKENLVETVIPRRSRSAALTLLAALTLGACSTVEAPKSPAFYENLARSGAQVNVAAAASLISDYRRANALPALEIDPALVAVAQDQARRMAAADKLTHDPGGRGLVQRLKAANYDAARAGENIGAGYHTLAEAFSGWRDSPSHKANLLLPGATKMGIATAYAPGSKYKVFWAFVLAEPDTGPLRR
jgi:uncharacterized protein YkwD